MVTERRAAIVSTVVVVLLAAAGVFALWPRPSVGASPGAAASAAATQGGAAGPGVGAAGGPTALGPAGIGAAGTGIGASGTGPGATGSGSASDAELAAPRAAAALTPCPAPNGTRPAGPLAGITVPCLGAPGAVDLGAALAGRVTLVNVWASWCAPCRAELPVLARYAGTPGAVPVLGVDTADDPRAALGLLAELGVHLPAVDDADGAVGRALRLPPALPLSYVVRADGSVAMVDPPVPFTSPSDVAAAVARLS